MERQQKLDIFFGPVKERNRNETSVTLLPKDLHLWWSHTIQCCWQIQETSRDQTWGLQWSWCFVLRSSRDISLHFSQSHMTIWTSPCGHHICSCFFWSLLEVLLQSFHECDSPTLQWCWHLFHDSHVSFLLMQKLLTGVVAFSKNAFG